jgi:periplasmic divalent cation tolerance protein
MILLYLSCATDQEAKTISSALLEAKLIACAKRSSVESMYWWQGKVYDEPETLLTMESNEANFDAIEAIVSKYHSYDQHVLTAVQVTHAAPGVQQWVDKTIRRTS